MKSEKVKEPDEKVSWRHKTNFNLRKDYAYTRLYQNIHPDLKGPNRMY